nr:hypothetical protein GCM10020093_108190 [Planobispora longispora]
MRFTVDPAAASTGAVAFGRPGRYVVCLYGGLLARRFSDPAGFEAVVLHELAHVRSGDVRFAYATTALWRVFLAGVLLPYAVLKVKILFDLVDRPEVFRDADLPSQWFGLAQVLVLTALLTLARADLLRNRELYADNAAVRWGASPAVWIGRAAGDRARGPWRAITDPWRTHPSWERRVRSLHDPSALFDAFPALPMLLTGAATLFTAAELPSLLRMFELPTVLERGSCFLSSPVSPRASS